MTDPLDALQAADEAPADHDGAGTHWMDPYDVYEDRDTLLARLQAAEAVCDAAKTLLRVSPRSYSLFGPALALIDALAKYREVAG